MDEGLWASLPGQLGVATFALAIIGYFIRANHAERTQYAELRSKSEEQNDKDIAELRAYIVELQAKERELIRKLDAERQKRWAAEDAAARYRRMAGVVDDDRGGTE